MVTVDTVTAQLVYEIQGPVYLNPDVTVHLDTVQLAQEGPDRVRVTGADGLTAAADDEGRRVRAARPPGRRHRPYVTAPEVDAKVDLLPPAAQPRPARRASSCSSPRLGHRGRGPRDAVGRHRRACACSRPRQDLDGARRASTSAHGSAASTCRASPASTPTSPPVRPASRGPGSTTGPRCSTRARSTSARCSRTAPRSRRAAAVRDRRGAPAGAPGAGRGAGRRSRAAGRARDAGARPRRRQGRQLQRRPVGQRPARLAVAAVVRSPPRSCAG